jgi:hypothetical protein
MKLSLCGVFICLTHTTRPPGNAPCLPQNPTRTTTGGVAPRMQLMYHCSRNSKI